MQEEYTYTCPYCWQRVTALIDLSVEEQSYVEDCEVCCRPIQIDYQTDFEQVTYFEANTLDG